MTPQRKNKNIVVIYGSDDWDAKIPISRDVSRNAWEDFHKRALKENICTYRASYLWFNSEKRIFEKGWAFRDERWIKIEKPIKPDLIFDKLSNSLSARIFEEKVNNFRGIKVLNDVFFQHFFGSKFNQYQVFGNYMPKTVFAKDKIELSEKICSLNGNKIVIKPLMRSGGYGVFIGKKEDLLRKRYRYPVLAQEFIKAYGIPRVTRKNVTADLRVVIFNHNILYAATRTAPLGSDFTNVHQGAIPELLNDKDIPRSVIEVVKRIDCKLVEYKYLLYCLDFIFDKDSSPILIELNTKPGVNFLTMICDEKIRNRNLGEFIKVIYDK